MSFWVHLKTTGVKAWPLTLEPILAQLLGDSARPAGNSFRGPGGARTLDAINLASDPRRASRAIWLAKGAGRPPPGERRFPHRLSLCP